MMSTKLIMFLMTVNIAVAISAILEKNYWRAVYWVGAATINFAVVNLK